jgi:micrococcal nuclease
MPNTPDSAPKSKLVAFLGIAGLVIVLILGFAVYEPVGNWFSGGLGLKDKFVSTSQSSKGNTADPSIENSTVREVVDGDTIKLDDGRTIRYLNMDTPETKKPNTAVQCFGPEASKLNKELVAGKLVWLKADKEDKDRYERSLRFVFLNENDTGDVTKSVNAQMVKLGFARSMIIKPNNTYASQFVALESTAKADKIGLWGVCAKPFEE